MFNKQSHGSNSMIFYEMLMRWNTIILLSNWTSCPKLAKVEVELESIYTTIYTS